LDYLNWETNLLIVPQLHVIVTQPAMIASFLQQYKIFILSQKLNRGSLTRGVPSPKNEKNPTEICPVFAQA
jgi:hypothetical protein